MQSTRPLARQKNLLLVFDAFGTLYQPNLPIPQAYGQAALRHGIEWNFDKPAEELTLNDYDPVKNSFRQAFKVESARNPNYGKATGLGAEKWWANIIRSTFQPFLKPTQEVPGALISELLTRYSTSAGYNIYPDVIPFFRMLKNLRTQRSSYEDSWRWEKTIVGIITNSDDRVPTILKSFDLDVGPRRVGSSMLRSGEAAATDDISFVVLSYDVGFEKPDRRIYDAATEMLKETLVKGTERAEEKSVDDYEKLYVGDSLETDYLGAKAAGWNSVLIDRSTLNEETLEHTSGAVLKEVDMENKSDGNVVKNIKLCTDLRALSQWEPPGK